MSSVQVQGQQQQARPFLKWVGGKTQLLGLLQARMPRAIRTYYEPFMGGAALFFATQHKPSVLSDLNLRLVRTYRAIRDNVDEVIEAVRSYETEHRQDAEKCYYFQRDEGGRDIDQFDDVSVAGWMIYLNKTGFNGLYRVNRSGKFNNPIGRMSNRSKTARILDEPNLRACAAALAGVDIHHTDFRNLEPVEGDFVYLDPPYVPVSKTSRFTAYTAERFGEHEQAELARTAAEWKRRGVNVLLSNASADLVDQLYRPRGFRIDVVAARRNINAQGGGRGPVAELLVY